MPDLPSGTVTFLFTDIEGSTALWERDQEAMRLAVERHLELLDAAIAAHGGIHFKTVGDAVQAAFATAPDALAAAVQAQQAIAAEPWALPAPIRVRMALHAGEATPDAAGDYHRCPRSTGWAGSSRSRMAARSCSPTRRARWSATPRRPT